MEVNRSQRTLELFRESLSLRTLSDSVFRKTVIQKIISEFSCSLSSASTLYNNAKKHCENSGEVTDLGRKGKSDSHSKSTKNTISRDGEFDLSLYCSVLINEANNTINSVHVWSDCENAEAYTKERGGKKKGWMTARGNPDPGMTVQEAIRTGAMALIAETV